ncbi:uncharacterized protein LOC119459879 isoform X2 [Dermacentor silvarum]|uniref:uncharacterized protein LOC119459879 isoform X2 n=1 Tax=Dermacentor silvarum TaxID=543639 RepID=UPI00210155A9|nr:uncharacterized protein LOC119459879 isoform X2 [Dermacentor silvarum]
MCPFGAQSWIRFFSLQEPAVRFWMSECRHRVPLQQLCWVELLTRRARASRLMWAKTQCLRNMLSVAMSHFMDTHGLYCAIHVSRWQVAVHMEEIIAIGSSRLLGNARTQRLRTFLSVAVSPFMDTTKSAASRRQLQAQPGPSSDQHCPTDALTSGSSSMDSFAGRAAYSEMPGHSAFVPSCLRPYHILWTRVYAVSLRSRLLWAKSQYLRRFLFVADTYRLLWTRQKVPLVVGNCRHNRVLHLTNIARLTP